MAFEAGWGHLVNAPETRPVAEPDANCVALIVPTRDAGERWPLLLQSITSQSLKPGFLLVIDSGSRDGTVTLAREYGFDVLSIEPANFDHGGTRQQAVKLMDGAAFIVFMTQDAILAAPDTLERLLESFRDPLVGAAFGRQLPRREANPIEAHARLFNYPAEGRVSSLADVPRLGIKAAFLSNSFAAYRRSALDQVGGFPAPTILGEDMIVGARMLLAGWKLVYRADACVYHSHAYTTAQEFRRYFDIGVMHAREPWLLERFGPPEGEGLRFLRSELSWLSNQAPKFILPGIARTLSKYFGYRLGRAERHLPTRLKRSLSMHKHFWDQEMSRHGP